VHEAGSVNLSKVTETCLLKVVRPLGIITATMFDVSCPRLQSVIVAMSISSVRVPENILAITAVVVEIGVISQPPISPPGSIKRTVGPYYYDPALGLSRRAG